MLDRLGLFDVFSSPWFAAIYLLLFVSLIGCVLPRASAHLRALRGRAARGAAPPGPAAGLRRAPRRRGRRRRSSEAAADAARQPVPRSTDGDADGRRGEGLPARDRQPAVPRRAARAAGRRRRSASCTATRATCWSPRAQGFCQHGPAVRRLHARARWSTTADAGAVLLHARRLPGRPTSRRAQTARQPARLAASSRSTTPRARPRRDDDLKVNHPLRRRRRRGLPDRPRLRARLHRDRDGEGQVAVSTAPLRACRRTRHVHLEGAIKVPDARPDAARLRRASSCRPRCDGQDRRRSFPGAANPTSGVGVYRGDLGLRPARRSRSTARHRRARPGS